MYKIRLSNKAVKRLNKIPKEIYLRLYEKMKSIQSNPRPNGCVKLTNSDGYRIRVGNFRILYEINDNESSIEIYDILDRKDAYKKK